MATTTTFTSIGCGDGTEAVCGKPGAAHTPTMANAMQTRPTNRRAKDASIGIQSHGGDSAKILHQRANGKLSLCRAAVKWRSPNDAIASSKDRQWPQPAIARRISHPSLFLFWRVR